MGSNAHENTVHTKNLLKFIRRKRDINNVTVKVARLVNTKLGFRD